MASPAGSLCSVCGRQLQVGDSFCSNCGARTAAAAPSQTQVSQHHSNTMSSPELKGYTAVPTEATSRSCTLREDTAVSSDVTSYAASSRALEATGTDEEPRTARLIGESNPELQLASAKFIGDLVSSKEMIPIESDSVYGAALVIPQIARSLDFPRELVLMSMTSVFYLAVAIILHAWLLTYIDKDEKVFAKFGGQMYLCDFGANLQQCTEDPQFPGCTGPGGTRMTAPRLYDVSTWITRVFVRDSLKGMFPNMTLDEINANADPGEYGIESYWCRVICTFIFILHLVPEAKLCIEMAQLLWHIPTQNGSWVEVKEESGEFLDHLRIKVAGMSRIWKIVNFIFVLLPKSLLLFYTAKAGVFFLMETAGIDAIIVNSVALGFLLGLDELITECLLPDSTVLVLQKCEGYVPGKEHQTKKGRSSAYAELADEDTIDVFYEQQKIFGVLGWTLLIRDFLLRYTKYFWIVIVAFLGFMYAYYLTVCQIEEGRWVSKPLHVPKSLMFSSLNAFLPFLFPLPVEEEPSWTMPES
eukprot:TRINITY_DN11816_c0_g1_i2.p1 TRINITY_DN11816_c0_g1~~TRINITY_DN11816_c0_g1_i2.p1  ORF type:complete len:543 (+),score=74.13 TRINITY_DN11816_c0_g1_i2:47-1630(+)